MSVNCQDQGADWDGESALRNEAHGAHGSATVGCLQPGANSKQAGT